MFLKRNNPSDFSIGASNISVLWLEKDIIEKLCKIEQTLVNSMTIGVHDI